MEKILAVVLILLTLILVFWAIIDIAKSRFKNSKNRTIWLVVVILFPIIGSILYFQLKRTLTTNEPLRFDPKFNRT